MPKSSGLFDSLANLIGEAITDVRQRAVEEGWFGRPTTTAIPNNYESFWEKYGTPDEWRRGQPKEQEQEIDL